MDEIIVKINLKKLHEKKHKYCGCKNGDYSRNLCPCDDFTKTGYCICELMEPIEIEEFVDLDELKK